MTGTVTDSSTGEPIVGASVSLQGSASVYAVTDENGHYTVTVPSDGVILANFLGYETEEVQVNGKSNLDIQLSQDIENLDDVIVVAYGTSKKAAFTGSAGVVKSESLEKRQVSNVSRALEGTMAGVQVQSANGQPGTSATVRIRGVGSINADCTPLYVVDGVPFEGDLSSLNSHDIESMTVLKDAASSALYGARGANGVIMVTTKQGREGKTNVTFDMKLGVNQRAVPNYSVMTSPDEYTEKAYQAIYNMFNLSLEYPEQQSFMYANQFLTSNRYGGYGYQIYTVPEGQMLIGTNGKLNPNATLGYSDGDYYYTPDNWSDNTYKNKLRQEYNVSVSGGTQKFKYYASFGYLDDKGIIDNSGFERYSVRSRGEYDITKWLKVGGIVSYSYNNSTYPSEQTSTNSSANAFMMANTIAPVYPMFIRNADGSKTIDSRGRIVYDYGDRTMSTNFDRSFMSMSNPVGDLLYDIRDYRSDILGTNWFATITPIKGLSFTARIGLDVDNTRYRNMGNPYYGQSSQGQGSIVEQSTRNRGLDYQYLAQYVHTFGKSHNIDIMVGYEGYDFTTDNIWGSAECLYNPNIAKLSNAINNKNNGGSTDSYSTRGIVSRINYDYDNKYFASVSYRRDGSSVFSAANRWGNFWSASAAWVMNKERWLQNARWISFLKFKASYGENGNDKVNNYYAYLDQFSMTGASSIFSDGTLVFKGNENLTWEKQKAFNVGFDFDFWDGRLSGSLEYYSRRISDMLYYKPVSRINGYSAIPMNVGAMTNSGVELTLGSDLIKKKNFLWHFDFNITYDNNKINSLHPDLEGEFIDGSRIFREGESMYQLYLVKYAGVDEATGEALYWAKNNGNEYRTTDWSVASSTNKQSTGNIKPHFYGGFGTSFDFYGVDISARFSYQLGGKVFDSGYRGLMHGGTSSYAGTNWHTDIRNSWTPENRNTNVPRVNSFDDYTNATSDRWLVDASYLCIPNITVGYTFPSKWMSRIKVSKLRLYCAIDNLAIFSARKGLDPRQSFVSSTSSIYAPIRTISGGLNLTF